MALALQTFATVKDANAALKAAGTRYLGGGTLVVRAANEGDVSVSGLVSVDRPGPVGHRRSPAARSASALR